MNVMGLLEVIAFILLGSFCCKYFSTLLVYNLNHCHNEIHIYNNEWNNLPWTRTQIFCISHELDFTISFTTNGINVNESCFSPSAKNRCCYQKRCAAKLLLWPKSSKYEVYCLPRKVIIIGGSVTRHHT